ncbi:MAG: nucleoside-triphosphatase [Spirochaetaceae bacterium]|nr:nucleoside-triphosphatase [Spirochaetaceae bacterium]MDT8297956.1 nucleoside-triphosphatase [Spirochaetaceae bacterium]
MIYLISGKKNQGKTTKLKALFHGRDNAFGFIADKVFDCGRVTKYELINLRDGEKRTIARLASIPLPKDWNRTFNHGPFLFSEEAFEWAGKIFDNAEKSGGTEFFLDELGKVELKDQGHAELIRRAVSSGMDLYITVRDTNISAAAEKFDLDEYQVIEVEPRA